MSDPEQDVDLSSLLNLIQTLTNQVNALQNPVLPVPPVLPIPPVPPVKPVTKKGGNRTISNVYGSSPDEVVRSRAYDISRNELVSFDASLCFAVVANSRYLSPSQSAMINSDTSFNLRYSKMEMYPNWTTQFIPDGFVGLDSSFNREVAVAKKFNILVDDYIKEYKPALPLSDASSQILNKQFPTHNYFPEMKNLYESNEIFKILDSFPKGGQLHIHSGALCDIDWVLRDGKYSNTSDVISTSTPNYIGLTYDLSNNTHGFFVNKDILDSNYKYVPGTTNLFTSFPIKTTATTTSVRYSRDYNTQTRVYKKDGVNWLDLRNNYADTSKMVLDESTKKSIRQCLTMIGGNTESS